jgi:hypothetical protein
MPLVTEERYWTLFYMPLYTFIHNLLNVLVQIANKTNKMGFQKEILLLLKHLVSDLWHQWHSFCLWINRKFVRESFKVLFMRFINLQHQAKVLSSKVKRWPIFKLRVPLVLWFCDQTIWLCISHFNIWCIFVLWHVSDPTSLKVYRFVRTSLETHYVSATSSTG